MKKIIIYQEGTEPITFFDDVEDENIDEYKEKLKDIFNYGNVIELEIPNNNIFLLIRPSKINGIMIKDQKQKTDNINQLENYSETNDDFEENIITDGE